MTGWEECYHLLGLQGPSSPNVGEGSRRGHESRDGKAFAGEAGCLALVLVKRGDLW